MKKLIHSGNWTPGRGGQKIEAVVIHIMEGTLEGTDTHFNTRGTFVSSHDGIGKGGQLSEYVDIDDTAYHAGRIYKPNWFHMKRWPWGALKNPNAYTYGIENEGYKGDLWTEAQMQMMVIRTKRALDHAGLPYTRDRVISHKQIASYKADLGKWCDEIVRRLNTPRVEPPQNNVAEATALLEQAITLLKTS